MALDHVLRKLEDQTATSLYHGMRYPHDDWVSDFPRRGRKAPKCAICRSFPHGKQRIHPRSAVPWSSQRQCQLRYSAK